MKHIIIRLVNDAGFVSYAIDEDTDGIFCHVELGVQDFTSSEPFKITSWIGARANGGVQERPFDYLKKVNREHRYAIPVRDEQYDKIMRAARAKIGTPYNFTDIIGLLFRKRGLTAKHKDICSQFTIEATESGGLYLLNVEPEAAHLITPDDIYKSYWLRGNLIYKYSSEEQHHA